MRSSPMGVGRKELLHHTVVYSVNLAKMLLECIDLGVNVGQYGYNSLLFGILRNQYGQSCQVLRIHVWLCTAML